MALVRDRSLTPPATDWDALLVGGLQWLRWFALAAVLALALLLLAAGRDGLRPVFAVLTIAAYNGAVHLAAGWIRWLRSYRNIAWLDMMVITATIYACGDPNCPAQLLYFLAAISGALSMRVRESLLFATVLGLVSVPLTVAARPELATWQATVDAASERLIMLVVIAGVSSLLVRRLLVVHDEAARDRLLARRLSLLNELLWQANATGLELDRLMPTMARLIHQALGGHLALTALLNDQAGAGGRAGRLLAWAADGVSPALAGQLADSLVVKDAIELKDAVVVWDAASDSRCADPIFTALGVKSAIAAPLCDDDGAFGVVLVAAPSPSRFSRTDVELLMAIASHAALPIRNARLHSLESEHASRRAALEQAKRDFLTIASHELRTPLAAVKLSRDVLAARLMPKLETDEQAILHSFERNIYRLERLVEDFLLLARLQSGSVQLHGEAVDLAEAIRAAVAELQPELSQKRQTIASDVPESALVLADVRRLRQILACLLSNANRFSPEGTAITVAVATNEREAVVSVLDRGVGIPPEQRERIFEPFVRLSPGSCEGRGAGLGLPIARALAELHSGRLWVNARADGGSAFRFAMPLARLTRTSLPAVGKRRQPGGRAA